MSVSKHRRSSTADASVEAVAGNGLLQRRALLGRGLMLAGAVGAARSARARRCRRAPTRGAADRRALEPRARRAHRALPAAVAVRTPRRAHGLQSHGQPGAAVARTPHHLVNGTITPNGLHFVVVYGGVPDIDPDQHRLVIHGLVQRPLVFTLETLSRYPMVTRVTFLECGGNSAPLFSPQPLQENVQALHGMASCAEWTGVPLATLLEETSIDPQAKWFIAEGADAPHLTAACRSRKPWTTP